MLERSEKMALAASPMDMQYTLGLSCYSVRWRRWVQVNLITVEDGVETRRLFDE